MQRRGWKRVAAYVGLLMGAFGAAFALNVKFGAGVDNYAYDFMLRAYEPRPWVTQSIILAIDEKTLSATQSGLQGIRTPLAKALRLVAGASPKAVAVDVILADRQDPAVDRELAEAFRLTPNLVLSSEVTDYGWEDPRPEFTRAAVELGHVHALPENDGVTRAVPLWKRVGNSVRWAISLEAFALSRKASVIQTPVELRVGETVIPAAGLRNHPFRTSFQTDERRLMRVRFVPANMPGIPRVSMQALLDNPSLASQFKDKVVFVGTTVQTLDAHLTPYSEGRPTSGIEIHANAFETMAQELFITDVSDIWVVLFSVALVTAAGLVFRYLPGWQAYAGAVSIIMIAHITPYVFFTHQRVFSFAMPAAAAWLGTMTAAGYYHLVVRRDWRKEHAARERYQQAMHFVTHEMRTPLSAIQGSSEVISRYPLTEEKRNQLVLLINSESKRLARMVEVFLNVEKLSAGQMELKRESISVKDTIEICVERVRPLADRKHITIALQPVAGELQLRGDRELMEYACYNLLTNAVKYSPQRTEVALSASKRDGQIRIAVKDQGIGMDQTEVKQIFQKFYRTKRAEESGEAGTGIGLSIVQQIVEQHGGQIEVTSQPGAGSCFTLVMPAPVPAPLSTVAERY
jgi:signal transduction histidine kinase